MPFKHIPQVTGHIVTAAEYSEDLTGVITDAEHGSRGAGLHADSHDLDHRGRQLLQVGTDAAKPAPGTVGRIYYATDTKIFYYDNGAAWVEYLRAETVSRLAQLAERAHASLTGITASQHHSYPHGSGGLTTGLGSWATVSVPALSTWTPPASMSMAKADHSALRLGIWDGAALQLEDDGTITRFCVADGSNIRWYNTGAVAHNVQARPYS